MYFRSTFPVFSNIVQLMFRAGVIFVLGCTQTPLFGRITDTVGIQDNKGSSSMAAHPKKKTDGLHPTCKNDPKDMTSLPHLPQPTARWEGPDGKSLPFKNTEEVRDFLKTAEVIRSSDVGSGITRPKKLLLQKNGICAHAIFHHIHDEKRQTRMKGGEIVQYFRDSYLNQVAAYEVSRLVNMTNIPPAVLREIDGKPGSVSLWIENAIDEKRRIAGNLHPPELTLIDLYTEDMHVFDNLINNIDRNFTNILYDRNWQMWLIDHTRAFGGNRKIPDRNGLKRCSFSLWEKLHALNRKQLRKVLRPYLNAREISTIMVRRDEILDVLQKKIDERGEKEVLFQYPSSY